MWTNINSGASTSIAQLDIAVPTGYREIRLRWRLLAAQVAVHYLRTSPDGSTPDVGANDYKWNYLIVSPTGTAGGSGSTGANHIQLQRASDTEYVDWELLMLEPRNTTINKMMQLQGIRWDNGGGHLTRMTAYGQRTTTAAIQGLHLLMDSGNIAAVDWWLDGIAV